MEIENRLALQTAPGETPLEEAERLTALRALHILDTPPEERFDRITLLAAELLDVPVAYVSFVDENRQWLKSCLGWDAEETPRDASICALTIRDRDPLIIPDALADARFCHHPMVRGEPFARFYAGYPLCSSSGHVVGTFCVADHRPRRLSERAADFHEPAEVLAALNEAFQMKKYHNMYFTIWYGVFNRKTRRLTYAAGGHPPALLVTDATTPRVERLRTRGLLIGGVRDVVYSSASVVLPEGSALYLFSDGVYEERREDGTMMDLDEFVDLLTEQVTAQRHEAQQILDRIEQIQRCETCLDDFALLRVRFD